MVTPVPQPNPQPDTPPPPGGRGPGEPDRQQKACLTGTHRVCPPEETLRRIEPLLGRMGITRLADVTWLDDTGVPVYQAVRPDSHVISVAQGKGLTPLLAKVSAAMESIETWHAERVEPGERAAVADVAADLGYEVDELTLADRHILNPGLVLEWSPARHLLSGAATRVPTDYLRLDSRTTGAWRPPLFEVSSNGLASGNTFEEAVLHGLYEVVERDAATRTGRGPAPSVLDLGTVDGAAREVADRLLRAGFEVAVEILDGPIELPCFRALIANDAFPGVFHGMGCHLDREVALCRALTEAVQIRLTAISGIRDDMPSDPYTRAADIDSGQAAAPRLSAFFTGSRRVGYAEIASVRQPSLADDLDLVGRRVARFTGRDPVVADHTRALLGVPVARVICPGLLLDRHVV